MITTDTGAKKWENSDNWRQIYQAHNDSVDAEDAAIAALQDAIAIVANGNTHAAIASGQFVFVKNHDTLAAGLYTANSAIAANATLTSSNLTADPSGGFNALNSKIAHETEYHKNDTLSVGNGDFIGRAYSSGSKVVFTIPIDRNVASDVSSISLSNTAGNFIIFSESTQQTLTSVSTYSFNSNFVRLTGDLPNAIANNSVVLVNNANAFTMTFS